MTLYSKLFFILGKVELRSNQTVNDLIEQLINDLKKKNEYEKYEKMDDRKRRLELLTLLHGKVHARRQKVINKQYNNKNYCTSINIVL